MLPQLHQLASQELYPSSALRILVKLKEHKIGEKLTREAYGNGHTDWSDKSAERLRNKAHYLQRNVPNVGQSPPFSFDVGSVLFPVRNNGKTCSRKDQKHARQY
jgi:hypothetical protein